ncbi:hypothetical protein GTP55_24260 [Duganella sp. FT109W]|uniref:Large polyvalent protein-associated domain-containing protein n=1 Tax=Duganella margarita TaxID=2692170 RepID=A0ABW9WMR7_9BURK|nr:hypothetical protein [Duganella margarita]MYN42459.1 hypothetical protein [Duganella margarita]
MNDKTEAAPLHDSLRDLIGQAISDEIAAGAEQPDWCDSREIDRLADAVLTVLPAGRESAPVLAMPKETPESMAESNTRFAIDGAIQFGREDRNKPPSEEHWLMEYWLIGQQLRELGKTGWDNRTPLDPAETSAITAPQQHAQAAPSDEREAFEKFYRDSNSRIATWRQTDNLGRNSDGDYFIHPIPALWEAWQACAILAARQPAPVASVPAVAVPGSEAMLVLLQDAARAWNNEREAELDATMERVESFLISMRKGQPAAAPVAADVDRSVAVLQSLLDEARDDNARLKAKLVIATTRPPAGAAPVDAKRTEPGKIHAKTELFHFAGSDVRLQIIDQYGTHEVRVHGDTGRFVVEAVASANRDAQPSTAQGDALRQVVGRLTREQQENANFLEWWESSGQKADHDLRTQNAAHATWQERAQRAASQPETVHVDVANQAINDAMRVGMQDSERDAARQKSNANADRLAAEWGVAQIEIYQARKLEIAMIENRIGITPEYDGGFHAHIYGESEKPMATGYGDTPSAAVYAAMAAQQGEKGGAA